MPVNLCDRFLQQGLEKLELLGTDWSFNKQAMVVRIRLARHGRRNLPFYNIVVANARTARNSKPIEKIGTYNPIPDREGNKMITLNFERAKYWLTVGAQPSEPVEKLLVKVRVFLLKCSLVH